MILCVKIASRGDLLLAAPTFRRLRQEHAGRPLSLLVGSSCADVAERLPYFDDVRVVDDRRLFGPRIVDRAMGARELFRHVRSWARDARRGGGSGAEPELLIFHRDWRYGLIGRLAGVPVRRGFASERGSRFLTNAYHPRESEHHVHQYLRMAGLPTGEDGPDPAVPREGATLEGVWRFVGDERARGLEKAASLGFDGRDGWVALGFGGGRNVKTQTQLKSWPIERFRALARELEAQGRRVVWLGDGHDAAALGSPTAGVSLAGALTVTESAAVLSACDLVVANDTFMLHLGEALGVPTLGLFGPTNAEEYRPLGVASGHLWKGADLACSPCHRDGFFPVCEHGHRCMREMSVDLVLGRARQLLASAAGPRPDRRTFSAAALDAPQLDSAPCARSWQSR